MVRVVTSQAEGLQELLLIVFGMVFVFAFGALIMAPRGRRIETAEPPGSPAEPPFDPRKNGRGAFYPWIPVA